GGGGDGTRAGEAGAGVCGGGPFEGRADAARDPPSVDPFPGETMKGPDVAVAGVAVEEECGGRHAGDVVADADGGVCVATLLDRPTGDRAAGVDPIREAGDAERGVGGRELDPNRGRAGRQQGDPVIEGVDEHGRACAYLEVG